MASIPAIYRSIQRFVPNTEVIIWPSDMSDELRALLEKSFTQLNLIDGEIDEAGNPTTDELKEAFETSDLFLYAPGTQRLIDWTGQNPEGTETSSLTYCQKINLPYMIYGLGNIPESEEIQSSFINILNAAVLSFVTESTSENKIKNLKLKVDNLEYGPSPIFAFDLKNDTEARQYLETAGLAEQDFISIIIKNNDSPNQEANSHEKKIISILESWIQATDHYVLLIANSREDINSLQYIYEDLTESAKNKTIVFDGIFSPDFISSVLEKSRISTAMSPYPLFSALISDIPVFYFADWKLNTDGQAFIDLGLKDYVMDINNSSDKDLLKAMLDINESYVKALLDTNKSSKEALKELQDSFDKIYRILTKINPVPKEKKTKKKKE